MQRKIALIDARMTFLKKHPAVASRAVIWQFQDISGLHSHYKVFIKPVRVNNK